MKILKQIVFTFAIVVGFSLTAFAQKDDQKKPPKEPPVINPREKPPREKPPQDNRGNDKPKKPNSFLSKTENGFAITFV